jgi:hypothetical protein
MRVVALALVAVAGVACSRRTLQVDAGGAGTIGLDAAGAGGGSDGGSVAIDAWSPGADAPPSDGGENCGTWTSRSVYAPHQILLVVDRSVPGDQITWRALLQTLVGQINATAGALEWGLTIFPKDGPACDASTVTAGADLPIVAGSTTHLLAHVAAAGLKGNGTPTAAAITEGARYLRGLANQYPRSLMLVTDGAPTCAGTTGALSEDAAQAEIDAVAAITAAAAEGFRTFVVAPSTTPDVNTLNALARAGAYPRQGDIQFFTETTLPELFLDTRPARSCVLALPGRPPAPDAVSVMLDGTGVYRDPSRTNGWEYTDRNYTAIELHGPWCDLLLAPRSTEVTITYGCP